MSTYSFTSHVFLRINPIDAELAKLTLLFILFVLYAVELVLFREILANFKHLQTAHCVVQLSGLIVEERIIHQSVLIRLVTQGAQSSLTVVGRAFDSALEDSRVELVFALGLNGASCV
jgi:hypothetical protein